MATLFTTSILLFFITIVGVHSFVFYSPVATTTDSYLRSIPIFSSSSSSSLRSILQDALDISVEQILKSNDDYDNNKNNNNNKKEVDNYEYVEDNYRVQLSCYESEADDISWLSALSIYSSTNDNNNHNNNNESNPMHISFTCWNGPRLDIPHIMISITKNNIDNHSNDYHVRINYCPRSYAGWDGNVQQDGTYPEPTTRAEYYERQRRTIQIEKFFHPQLQQWSKQQPYTTLNREIPEGTSGPVRIEVSVPGPEHAVKLMKEAMNVFDHWRRTNQRSDSSVQAMQLYSFDCKTRPAITAMQIQHIKKILPPSLLATQVCEAMAGPRDLADRSAAMTAAALTNFDIDHMVEATEKD